jgi:citrate synthase
LPNISAGTNRVWQSGFFLDPTTIYKGEKAMNDVATPLKPKKSVALSGVVAGNTALCTVGRSGNDLHYRGYDILDIDG